MQRFNIFHAWGRNTFLIREWLFLFFYLQVVLKWNLVDWASWLHAKLEIEFHSNNGVELNIFLKIK